jgi:hypothetical protein
MWLLKVTTVHAEGHSLTFGLAPVARGLQPMVTGHGRELAGLGFQRWCR